MTPIIETMRSLLTEGTTGPDLWTALAWAAGILIVSSTLALEGLSPQRSCPGRPVDPASAGRRACHAVVYSTTRQFC